MNPFTLFKLIQFDTQLDKHLEKIIFTFYLSFGTDEAKMINREISGLHALKNKLLIESRNQNLDDLTLWRFYVVSRNELSNLQYYNWKYGGSIKYHIYYDIAIILLQSNIYIDKDKNEKEIRQQHLISFRGILDNLFKSKQTELFHIPNNIGTPTALVMRDHIQIFTLHHKKALNDSLWRLRIRINWGAENKLCDMSDVCSNSVYSELVNAYNQTG